MFGYDIGPIRPPSEAQSLLIRISRNCPWNKCEFCNVYKDTKFEAKSLDEIKSDIDAAAAAYNDVSRMVRTAFLQDANALLTKTDLLVEAIRYLKERFPAVERITTYARSSTAAKKPLEDLRRLKDAGLTRVHVGFESGSAKVLEYVRKGVTPEQHIEGGRKVKEAGLSLSEYLMPGLGGMALWREHALESARVLSEIGPDFIRLRSLSVRPGTRLYEKMKAGDFVPLSELEKVKEIRLFIENLDGACGTTVVSDHILNLLQEVEGRLPDDKEKMLGAIDRFLGMEPARQENFLVGSRLGYYRSLDDMGYGDSFRVVQALADRIREESDAADVESYIRKRMEEVI
ncbi:MAG: radical SAM protein [bacterium]